MLQNSMILDESLSTPSQRNFGKIISYPKPRKCDFGSNFWKFSHIFGNFRKFSKIFKSFQKFWLASLVKIFWKSTLFLGAFLKIWLASLAIIFWILPSFLQIFEKCANFAGAKFAHFSKIWLAKRAKNFGSTRSHKIFGSLRSRPFADFSGGWLRWHPQKNPQKDKNPVRIFSESFQDSRRPSPNPGRIH